MSSWQFAAARVYFSNVLEDWWAAYRQRCARAKRHDVDMLQDEEKEFREFIEMISVVAKARNPMIHLSPPPPQIAFRRPEVFQIKHGRWRAYFAVSVPNSFLVGLLVLHMDHAPALLDQMLESASGEWEDEHPPSP